MKFLIRNLLTIFSALHGPNLIFTL